MPIDVNELHALPDVEKLRIVEMLWDDLEESETPIPLPDWLANEVARRHDEMQNPSFGISHEETWRRIANCENIKPLPPTTN